MTHPKLVLRVINGVTRVYRDIGAVKRPVQVLRGREVLFRFLGAASAPRSASAPRAPLNGRQVLRGRQVPRWHCKVY